MIPEFDMSDENIFDSGKTVTAIKQSGLPLFIWGCDITAEVLQKKLALLGVKAEGFITDRDDVKVEGVLPRKIFLSQNPGLKYGIIRGFRESFCMSDEEIKSAWRGCEKVYTMADCYDGLFTEEISRDFYLDHKNEFGEVYDNLADDLSKKSLLAYLQSKVLKTQTPILSVTVSPQYFFAPASWRYEETDILIDCGAFDGDSILDFVSLRGDNYEEIIACEPDPNNIAKLKENLAEKNVKNFVALNVGIGGEKSLMSFNSSAGVASSFTDEGDIKVPIDTIDDIAGSRGVTIIKMDIEGFEVPGLEGGEHTIKTFRPMLMISAYHKRDDILKIYRYVNSIVGDYKFFFRCHKTIACDAVLYAIPKERII